MGWLWGKAQNIKTAHFYKNADSRDPFALANTTHLPLLLWWGDALYIRGWAKSAFDAGYIPAMRLEDIRVPPPDPQGLRHLSPDEPGF